VRLRGWVGAGPFWAGAWLFLLEVVVVTCVALICGWRAIQYGLETHWKFNGMLSALSDNWRGALILGGALFYRTLLEVLSRMQRLYNTWGEVPVIAKQEKVPSPKRQRRSEGGA
jgi:hypothetical protein